MDTEMVEIYAKILHTFKDLTLEGQILRLTQIKNWAEELIECAKLEREWQQDSERRAP